MKKRRIILSGLALSAALMLGMATPAFAAGEPEVNKTLQVNDGTAINATFQFDIEAVELETNVQGVTTAMDATLPTIAGITVTDDNPTGSSTVQFAAWPHAGTYAWKVTERSGTYIGDGDVQYDPQVYTIIADVKNAAQGGGYDVSYVVVKGLATSTNNLGADKVTSLDFTNKFTIYSLGGWNPTITKQVTGGGDTAQQFEFTVTFTAPTVLPANKTAADVLNEITPITTGGATVTEDPLANPGDTTRTFKFTAAHNQSIEFSNVLMGTTYSVFETVVNGYTQSWSYMSDQVQHTNTDNILVGNGGSEGTMVNTYDVTPPTGLLLNSLPFVLMGLVAVAGVVAYSMAKRKIVR